ncbi:hypothetical protein FACS189434_06870 [Bacteroidia bacterium]|nr:hypothetical protein FACS189434_06870 [Bacteroidia bacterium]
MYSKKTNIVVAFHGCDLSVRDKIVNQKEVLKPSTNSYDWLGHGCYFWENNETRALQFAKETAERTGSIKEPAVLGAYIDLGFCLDLLDSAYLRELIPAYLYLKNSNDSKNIQMPSNEFINKELLLRDLDCAVIQTLHTLREDDKQQSYDTVRGVFWEGEDLYPNAGMKEKNHIQICVRNINAIKAFFIPRELKKNPIFV